MRAVLNKGSIFCCLIGVIFVSVAVVEVIRSWPELSHKPNDLFIASLYFWPMGAYTLLAFAPAAMLGQGSRVEKRWRLIIIGIAELIVIMAFFAMLIAKLFPET